jgi:general secretion pathway protein G
MNRTKLHRNKRSAFTLVEILIVVVIMAILAATIIPQFTDSTKDAKASTGKFNLHTLRSQIQLYRAHHEGAAPGDDLLELMDTTDADGTIGAGASFPYGPYISELPANPFTSSTTVKEITNDPAAVGDVTGTGGWLYNPTTGGIWMDHADHYQE